VQFAAIRPSQQSIRSDLRLRERYHGLDDAPLMSRRDMHRQADLVGEGPAFSNATAWVDASRPPARVDR
jgi:hypothetical protein